MIRTFDDDGSGDQNPTLVAQFSEGNRQFALNLYQTMIEDQGVDSNLFCSPFSVTVALCMTLAGVRGNSAAQLRNVLKLPETMSDENLHSACEDIMKSLNLNNDLHAGSLPFILYCANRMYADKSFKILMGFVSTMLEHYKTGPKAVDFLNNGERARQEINAWVEEVTKDKIKDLIPPGVINEQTTLVLVTAIYFMGTWTRCFYPRETVDAKFYALNSTVKTVKMMKIDDYQEKIFYSENEDLQCKVLQLPYVGERLSMFVILPNQVDGLAALEKRFCQGDTLAELLKVHKHQYKFTVKVAIPKFKLESTIRLSDNVLRRMGIQDLFCLRKADLSGITDDEELYISTVIHKAFVDVNEAGTEAGAVTELPMASCIVEYSEFIADHPFMFLIMDKATELILFAGRLVDPPAMQ